VLLLLLLLLLLTPPSFVPASGVGAGFFPDAGVPRVALTPPSLVPASGVGAGFFPEAEAPRVAFIRHQKKAEDEYELFLNCFF
jgi:hypothetical protein